ISEKTEEILTENTVNKENDPTNLSKDINDVNTVEKKVYIEREENCVILKKDTQKITTTQSNFPWGEELNCDFCQAYNLPARVDPACSNKNFFMNGSILYWHTSEQGLDLGFEYFQTTDGGSDISNNRREISMNFEYKPGLRIGIGKNGKIDDWAISLDWTHIYPVQKRSFSTENNILGFWTDEVTEKASVKAQWKLKYDIFNLSISRPYYVGRYLIFNTLFGLKGGRINQLFDVEYTEFSSDDKPFCKANSSSWLVGPKVLFDTNWILGKGFSLIGDFAFSLFYQKFNDVKLYINNITSIQHFSRIKDNNCLTPNINSSIGISWGKYSCNKSSHLNFSLSYEFEYYWNQNAISNLKTAISSSDSDLSKSDSGLDLMLHGLSANIRFDF
ncbi:MAG: Lpg1974 family pore-forming outer membrane protein, partial [Parachlamydiales bacterium]